MTRDEFKILVKAMKAVYTEPSFIPDQDAFNIWYEMLKDLDYNTTSFAVKKHLLSSDKVPRVANIRSEVSSLQEKSDDELNEMAAWGLVQKALRRCGYYAEEEFEKLPEIVQRAIASPGQLREWAMMEDIDGRTLNVMQSNFMRTFRVEQEREKERRKLSPDLVKLVQKETPRKIVYDKPLSVSEEREIAEKNRSNSPEKIDLYIKNAKRKLRGY